jgi:hypothetical protein
MSITEKFEEKTVTFSDKKAIIFEFKHIFFRIRAGRLPDFIVLLGISLCVFFEYKPSLFIAVLVVLLIYLLLVFRTFLLLKSEFKQKYKLVGTFKIIRKHSSRGNYSFETKFDYIKINKAFFEEFKVGNCIRVEKFKTGRVFKVEKI